MLGQANRMLARAIDPDGAHLPRIVRPHAAGTVSVESVAAARRQRDLVRASVLFIPSADESSRRRAW